MKHNKQNCIKILKCELNEVKEMIDYYRRKGLIEKVLEYNKIRYRLEDTLEMLTNKKYFEELVKYYDEELKNLGE